MLVPLDDLATVVLTLASTARIAGRAAVLVVVTARRLATQPQQQWRHHQTFTFSAEKKYKAVTFNQESSWIGICFLANPVTY